MKFVLKNEGEIRIKKVEMYFRDLTPEAQNRLLKDFETSAQEEN